ncbi:hypothetical protein N7456_003545 [Penicillium angulare]|uniref:Uncharacterized protein n=1 Tax=Penicillium angulare TaxID=116970 RepID=A0A9W9FUU4_9EURO|nr:hypothetical protein N7456_003545 [Penicillium angulare]
MEEAFMKAISKDEKAQRGELFLLPMETFIVDVQDQASCYFFEVFDWVGASTFVEGSFDHNTVMCDAPLGERALMAGISAVGKASLANIQKSTSLRESASDDYVTTLKFVNLALGDPEQYRKCSTLTAIFLLSIFELVVGRDQSAIENWLNHVGGATRIIETRTSCDTRNGSSPVMFHTWRTHIVLDLANQFASSERDPVSASTRELTFIISKLASLRHEIQSGKLGHEELIITQLESLSAELDHWEKRVSPSSRYDEVLVKQPLHISDRLKVTMHGGYAHKYSAFWAADMWNQYRTTKFRVHDMLLSHLRPDSTKLGSKARQAQSRCIEIRNEMRQLADAICCSVPYIFGFLGQDKQETSAIAVKSSTGAFTLLWPLTVAALADPNPSRVTYFCLQCFDIITDVLGIQQGAVARQWVLSLSTQYSWVDNFDLS